MGNIIPLPNRATLSARKSDIQKHSDNSSELHSAEILIFPGVRYMHHASEGEVAEPQLSKR